MKKKILICSSIIIFILIFISVGQNCVIALPYKIDDNNIKKIIIRYGDTGSEVYMERNRFKEIYDIVKDVNRMIGRAYNSYSGWSYEYIIVKDSGDVLSLLLYSNGLIINDNKYVVCKNDTVSKLIEIAKEYKKD